ncbi:hypothetical protein HY493_04015 [Candidatus Woesearchaeota archaeon]|nr:hypothetical protein [Candidatus Woesearchaeota archaeon]
MGIFDAFKKKKESAELPPPPMPDLGPELPPLPEQSMEAPEPPQELMPEAPETPEPMHEEPTAHEEREAPVRTDEGPLFVSVQDYQTILNSVNMIRSKLGDAEDSFKKLHDIKQGQEKELEDWRSTLEDVQRKLTYVDEVLFGK